MLRFFSQTICSSTSHALELTAVVSMGRPLVPTQSLPAFNSPHFMTAQDTYRSAELIINKEAMRANEIQPYAATIDALDLAPATRAELDRRLAFGPDGQVRVERGTKRDGQEDDDEGDEDLDTINPNPAVTRPPHQFTTQTADFPPVFTAPTSQPELFDSAAMPPPPVPLRATRGLPRRGFSKTVSAPVGRLGTWSGMEVDPSTGFAGFSNYAGAGAGGAAAAGTTPAGPVAAPFTAVFGGFSPSPSFAAPKEEAEEDGFDVSEWAANEQF